LGTLQGLAERARGISQVIQERERALRQALIASADENVIATLEADAAKLASDLEALETEEKSLIELRNAFSEATKAFEAAQADFEERFANHSNENDITALAGARERIALLERQLASLRENARRATSRLSDARQRNADATQENQHNEAASVNASRDLEAAVEALRIAAQAAERAEEERVSVDEAFRVATEVAARTQARADALARALEEFSGAGGRAIIGNLEGVLGSFLDLIDIDEGWERAVESAAGASVGAMVVDGRTSARRALELLRKEGGAGLILPVSDADVASVVAPQGTTSLRGNVRARAGAPAHVTRVLDALFSRAFVAADWESGMDVASRHGDLVIVTKDGDRFASSGWRVSSGRSVVTRSTVEEAQVAAAQGASDLEEVTTKRREVHQVADEARKTHNAALATETAAKALVEKTGANAERVAKVILDTNDTVESLVVEVADTETQIVVIDEELVTLREELPALESAVDDAQAHQRLIDEARAGVEEKRGIVQERSTDVSRREAEFAERRRITEQRREEIELRLEGRNSEREAAAERRVAIEFDLEALARLGGLVGRAAEEIKVAQGAMDSTYREQLEASRASAERLEEIRKARNEADKRLISLGDSARKSDIEAAELTVMTTNLHEVIRRDLACEPASLGEAPDVVLPEGSSLEQFVGELEARITSLGPINPLALEELQVLEARYVDLDTQVSDVRTARKELHEVIRALDEEIMTTFMDAYADVNENFSRLIGMTFPGGQGRLSLTDAEDPLNTGVEIEVRPMGRNIRRISLLSGGERSMAALAFLFAVFRSRPSPFYMMDEVEAALDDVNLQRFLSVVDDFRNEAQLLIVTHQKRTMEAADALYGVTMVPGASSKVVSQRVKRDEPLIPAPTGDVA
jgi:chromosome segregation protein